MISAEQYAQIRRLFFAEHWKVGTIASELGIHPDAVHRAIEVERFGPRMREKAPSILDPFKPFIVETLERHARLRSTRLFLMVQVRGYKGGIAQLRRYVRTVRPAKKTEAYLRLETLPGEQGQVDWASFGKIQIGSALRPLSCFVMVLSFSRAFYARYTLEQTMESFLRGHTEAFEAFGGAPRTLLYDNLKSVVLERVGEHIRFHPRILELAGHYHFEPRPCAPFRGNEKGKVERVIQYLRSAFFEARSFRSVGELNEQLRAFITEVAEVRPRPADAQRRTVRECLEEERTVLIELPRHRFECDLVRPVQSGKQPFIRFDKNDYSIPHTFVRKPLTLVASDDLVRILHAQDEIARHHRSYDRAQLVEDPEHRRALGQQKRAARELTGRDRLRALCPPTEAVFEHLARRGEPLGHHTLRLGQLLDRYGAHALSVAMAEALSRGAPTAPVIAHLCDWNHQKSGAPPLLTVVDHPDPRVRDLRVLPHDLAPYDQLADSAELSHD